MSSSGAQSSLFGDDSIPSSPSEVDSEPSFELDGHDDDPIAICGFSLKFPDDATSPDGFWEMLLEKRCASREFPSNRMNADGFYQPTPRLNTTSVKKGHFIAEDPTVFDADFFSISATEAASLDPQQKWLLEVAYTALENAGISMESVSGSSTGVYTGSFGMDHIFQLCRDPENPAPYAALGLGLSMLANRLSWFFNLRGPSIGVDSACSSTAMALDLACQALHTGACEQAMIAGCNTAGQPETYSWMTNINFLSPDGRSYSFDSRANGYARGEGIAVMILKKLSHAIRDGNTIRAVIRATGSNEDGKTPSITQPSREAQEMLIRETYRKACLSMEHTRFFEAHGTGTAVGDPLEAQAIGCSFRKHRSLNDPLYVGAVKSNIGHLEGASGVAGVIKAVLTLEKGVIPPNANFQKPNPKIDTEFLRVKFPQEATPWPTNGLRRASINSFGYGGSNSHIVLDDAYNYMRLRSLDGKHRTAPLPPRAPKRLSDDVGQPDHLALPTRLLVWSTADKAGIDRIAKSLQEWDTSGLDANDPLGDLAYTLDSHRSRLGWRSFALAQSPKDLLALPDQVSEPVRVKPSPPRLGYVFSGQGAQWYAMGRELLCFASYEAELDEAGAYLATIGCPWQPKEELLKSKNDSNIDKAAYSQILSAVLQVALVNLFQRFGIHPSAAVGHSSGEVAAAYASGAISRQTAWKISYLRGVLCAKLAEEVPGTGGMAAVGLSESEAQEVIDPINARATSFGLAVACINSPKSVTVSGETHLLDTLEGMGDQMFVRRLRVPLAYHSGQMQCIAGDYEASLGTLSAPDEAVRNVPMISSVTGERVAPERLREASYWALNLVSPVRFIDAISNMVAEGNLVKRLDGSHAFASVVDHILELGPHSALEVPLSDILATCKRGPSIGYTSALKRGKSATDTMLRAAGELWCMGLSPNLRAVNEPQGDNTSRSMLVNVPEYPFDRSQRYVHETRISHNYKFRQHAPSELVGVMTADSTPSEARWRHFIRLSESPWAESHVINGTILYPAAGMIVMAIEAAKQLAGRGEIDGFTLRDVRFISPMDLSAHGNGLEVQTSLTLVTSSDQEAPTFKFVIRNFNEDNRDGSINAQGIISVDLFSASEAQQWKKAKMLEKKQTMAQELASKAVDCDTPVGSARHYKFLEETGLGYGPSFQNLRQQRCNVSRKHAAAEVGMFSSTAEPHTVHPATLDAMFHLSFTALSSGGREAIATAVVTRVDRIWVSNKGLSAPETNSLNACLSLDKSTSRSQHYNGGAWACRSGKDLRLWIENLQTTSVTSVPDRVFGSLGVLVPPPAVDPKQFCMTVDTKPALDWLSTEETLSLLPKPGPEETHTSHTLPLEVLCLGAIERLLNTVDQATLDNREPWVKQYWAWAEHLFAKHREAWDDPQSALGKLRAAESWEQLSKRLSSKNGLSHGFVTVANSLPELIKGEITPLELLMVTGVLDKLYRAAGTLSPAQAQAAQYVDLLAHQKPGLNILEVGGGTASTTRLMVEALAAKPLGFGTLRCKRYTFTDVSSAFLESARDEFASYRSQMTFGTLDLDKDVLEQGYEEGTYDLVIADNVIHATLDIDSTLRNIRKLLKPGGQIMMHELLNPDGWFAGFVFGLFPGWWLGADKGRELSPLLDADGWDLALKGAGYNGADLILCDIPEGQPTRYAYVIASASSPAIETPVRRSDACVLIVNTASAEQQRLVGTLAPSLEEYFGSAPQVVNFDDAGVEAILQNPNHLAISLLEFTPLSFLLTLSETTWPRFKKLLRASRRMLWVSAGGGENPSPEHGMMDGLARTLRLENFELQLITVGLESLSLEEGAKSAQHVVQLAKATACLPPGENYEQEFLEIDGLLHTRRLTEANRAQSAIHDFLKKVVDTPLAVREAQFEIRTAPGPGHESGMYYTESAVPAEEDLGSSDVDVLVKAVSLQGLEPEAALAFGKGPVYCNYCAGVVLRAGPDTRFQEGDNVLVAQADSWRSHVRASSASVVSLPADVSFEDACATAPFMAMAHHALDEMARVRPGDTLLIQDGASPVGQAAIRLLGQLGVQDVWITVSDRDEQAWAAQHSGLPEHRILPKSSVDGTQIMSFEWKQRFDIVLSPYARDGEPLTMNCVRPGGRYIMLRSGASGTTQELQGIPSSISLSIIQHGSEPPFPSSLRKVVGTLREWNLRDGFRNATYYSAPELPAASSRIQNLHTGDAAVIAFKDTDVIEVLTPKNSSCTLRPDASYLISGAGGVGRELARWLVSRGARSLILLSRSGSSKAETRALMVEFQTQGVHVEAPVCDIADQARVRSVLDDCATRMPPIAGCIQSAMHMTESVFDAMSFEQWNSNISPKIRGSWNLHLELPKGLDFFVLASSVMGITGGGGLAAYNAGNTFQDALARHRVSQGEHAFAINIGPVPDAGYVAEAFERNNSHVIQHMASRKFAFTYIRDVCAVLDKCCDPADSLFRTTDKSQLALGLRPPAHWSDSEEPTATMYQPFWGHMHHITPLGGEGGEDGPGGADEERAAGNAGLTADASTPAHVAKKLVKRVSRILGTSDKNIDAEFPMDSYGLDSLSAIHLRNWIGKSLGVDMQVFELLGSTTFTQAATAIVRKLAAEEK